MVKIQNANTDLKIGYCLDPHDLAAAKLAAGREKDGDFVRVMLARGIAQPGILTERIERLPLAPERRANLAQWVSREARPANANPSEPPLSPEQG